MYAGFPPILTITQSSEMGNFPFTTELLQLSVTGERFVPKIDTHEFVTPPAWKLAPFSTAEMTGNTGGARGYGASPAKYGNASVETRVWAPLESIPGFLRKLPRRA